MSKNHQFQKFITHKSNAAKKEEFKQEKRAAKKQRAAAIDKKFAEKRTRVQQQAKQAPHNNQKFPRPISGSPSLLEVMPLNKFLAHSGVSSRRDAAELIRKGEVKVNDQLITEPGTKVSPSDKVTLNGKKIHPVSEQVYILLNKPKDYITTLDDPDGRRTVMDLIRAATTSRVYPVGRLDRNTSGVLLITNDGELAQTLSHPSSLVRKIYEVRLNRALTKADFDKLLLGVTLEDGFIVPDALGYADPADKGIIGIEIHSGRNRIVRRLFEFIGYDVKGLDRVSYAGLTKKNVQRGKWRFLNEKEVRILKHFNPQTKIGRTTTKPLKASPKTKQSRNAD